MVDTRRATVPRSGLALAAATGLALLLPSPMWVSHIPLGILTGLVSYHAIQRGHNKTAPEKIGWYSLAASAPALWCTTGALQLLPANSSAGIIAASQLSLALALLLGSLAVALLVRPSATQFIRRTLDSLALGLGTVTTWVALGTYLLSTNQTIPGLPAITATLTNPALLTLSTVLAATLCAEAIARASITLANQHLRSIATGSLSCGLILASLGHVSWIVTNTAPANWLLLLATAGCAVAQLCFLATTKTDLNLSSTKHVVAIRPHTVAPYLPTLVALGALALVFSHSSFRTFTLAALIGGLFCLTGFRQLLSTHETQHLLRSLIHREAQTAHQAMHDNLTGLENRVRFLTNVDDALTTDEPGATQVAVIDLDNFGAINDSVGHAAADRIIVAVADRLNTLNPGCLAVARLAADEFAVLLARTDDPDAAGQRIVTGLREPFVVDRRALHVTGSVGIATANGPVSPLLTGADLLNRADQAMYLVKHSGRDGYRVHSPFGAGSRSNDRLLAPALDQALTSCDVETVYQPICAAQGGRLIGFEALSRWSLNGKAVRPDIFVGVAERCGMIDRLTDLVIDRACAQLAEWNRTTDDRRLTVAVNLGGYSLRDRELPHRILSALETHRVEPGQLRLEVTETVPIADIESAYDVLSHLRERGVLLSLDDFGTGYNSISQLLRLPVTLVKIERSLTSEIHSDPNGFRIVQGMFELAQHLGLGVVAEGVETAEQLALLQYIGVDAIQGFFIGRPEPAEAWTEVVAAGFIPTPTAAVPPQVRPKFPVGKTQTPPGTSTHKS